MTRARTIDFLLNGPRLPLHHRSAVVAPLVPPCSSHSVNPHYYIYTGPTMNTPAWLQDSTTEASATPVVVDNGGVISVPPPAPPAAAAPSNAAAAADSDEDTADLPGIILTMRLANMGVACAMIAVSVRSFVRFTCSKSQAGIHDSMRIAYIESVIPSGTRTFFLFSLTKFIPLLSSGLADVFISLRQLHCSGSLRELRWSPHLLSRNTAQIRSCRDCPELWLFVQFSLEVHLLFDARIGRVELR